MIKSLNFPPVLNCCTNCAAIPVPVASPNILPGPWPAPPAGFTSGTTLHTNTLWVIGGRSVIIFMFFLFIGFAVYGAYVGKGDKDFWWGK